MCSYISKIKGADHYLSVFLHYSRVTGQDTTTAKIELIFHTEILEDEKITFADTLIQIIKENAPRRTFPDNQVALVLGPLYAYLDSLQPELTNPELVVRTTSTTEPSRRR